jgi:hypothetical protein
VAKEEALKMTLKFKIKKIFNKIIDNNVYTFFMTVLTVYALFGDDLRLLVFTKSDDQYFFGITSLCLFFFAMEIILASYSKVMYYLMNIE